MIKQKQLKRLLSVSMAMLFAMTDIWAVFPFIAVDAVAAANLAMAGKKFAFYRGNHDKNSSLAEVEIYLQRAFQDSGVEVMKNQAIQILSSLPMNAELFKCAKQTCLKSISKTLSSDFILAERKEGAQYQLVFYDRSRDRIFEFNYSSALLSAVQPIKEAGRLFKKLFPDLSVPLTAGVKGRSGSKQAAAHVSLPTIPGLAEVKKPSMLSFISNVDVADVSVNGVWYRNQALNQTMRDLEPGIVTVEVKREGYKPFSKKVNLVSGETRVVEFYMAEEPQLSPPTAVAASASQPTAMPARSEAAGNQDLSGRNFDRENDGVKVANNSDSILKKWWFWTAVAITATGGAAFGLSQVLDQQVGGESAPTTKHQTVIRINQN